jgi:hypothetical protein
MPYILSTWIGPKVHAMALSEASMMHQQVVERMTSPLSLGVNRSLLGRKCDPFLPGLLYHCSTQHAYIYIYIYQHHICLYSLVMSKYMHSIVVFIRTYEVDGECQQREWDREP